MHLKPLAFALAISCTYVSFAAAQGVYGGKNHAAESSEGFTIPISEMEASSSVRKPIGGAHLATPAAEPATEIAVTPASQPEPTPAVQYQAPPPVTNVPPPPPTPPKTATTPASQPEPSPPVTEYQAPPAVNKYQTPSPATSAELPSPKVAAKPVSSDASTPVTAQKEEKVVSRQESADAPLATAIKGTDAEATAVKTPLKQQEPLQESLSAESTTVEDLNSALDALSDAPSEIPATSPITYAKDQVTLLPAKPIKESDQSGVLFQMEIRSAGSAINPDWFQLSGFQPNNGLLLTYDEPETITIEPANVFAYYDVIALNRYGEVEMILPNIVLAKLTEAISPPEPVSALMYVAGGSSGDIGLAIGDKVQHAMFANRGPLANTGQQAVSIDVAPAPADAAQITENAAIATNAAATAVDTPTEAAKSPAEEPQNSRRKPTANPIILKPEPPVKPSTPQVQRPVEIRPLSAVEPAAGGGSDVSNSNLQQATKKNQSTEPKAAEKPSNFLDMILNKDLF